MSKAKNIAIGTCVVVLIAGCKYLDVQTRNIAGYDTFLATTRTVEIENAPTAMEANSKSTKQVVNTNYSIPISRGSIERFETSDEDKVKRINSILKGKLANKGAIFLAASKENGIDVYRQVAIVAHETGFGTQGYIISHNNVGGITSNNGGFVRFKTVDESIRYHAKLLKRYAENGRETLTDIQKIYAPIGAKNDPQNINRHWLPNTLAIYNKLAEVDA